MRGAVRQIKLRKLLSLVILLMPQVGLCAGQAFQDYFGFDGEPAPITVAVDANRGLVETRNKLLASGFQAVAMRADSGAGWLDIQLYHPRISEADRTVGRAARIVDSLAPDAFTQLRFCYLEDGTLCSVCYEFQREKLSRYFKRLLSRWQLKRYANKERCGKFDVMTQVPSNPVADTGSVDTEGWQEAERSDGLRDPGRAVAQAADDQVDGEKFKEVHGGVDKRHLDNDLLSGFNLYQSNYLSVIGRPVDIGRYLNDADGDGFLDLQSSLIMDAYLLAGWAFHGDIFYRWINSDEDTGSNSELAHVRSDIDLYRDENLLKVDKLYVSYLTHVGKTSAFAATFGYQEEMFAGLSTQLYFPEVLRELDLDLRFDYLKQRETNDSLGFTDYDVSSALLGVHWRGAPYLNDVQLFAGRFLAKDSGARLDLGHRFSNGIRLSFWYSHTDTDDTTKPGSSSSPYRGRGFTFSVPLGAWRAKDTRRSYDLEYVPHLRDTAQMLDRPIDLSNSAGRRALQNSELRQFGQ